MLPGSDSTDSSVYPDPVVLVVDQHSSQTGRHFVAAVEELNMFELLWVPKMSTPLSPIETFWNVFKHHFKAYNYQKTFETKGCGPRDTPEELKELLRQFATPSQPDAPSPLNDTLEKLPQCIYEQVSASGYDF